MSTRRRSRTKPLSKANCGFYGKTERGVSSEICDTCPDGIECETARTNPTNKKPATVIRLNRRKSQAQAVLERAKIQLEKDRLVKLDELFDSFDEFRETALNYIKQEIPSEELNPEYHQFKRAEELRKLLEREYRYAKKTEQSYKIQGDFKWPKWTNLQPRGKKVSKLFKPIYSLLWRETKTITYKRTKELAEKYNLPLCGNNYHVIVIPDLAKMSEELETTIDNVRKQIRKWTNNAGPVKRLGMTTQKRDGGKMIYSVGQWIDTGNDMMKRNPFLTQKSYEQWLRGIYW